jgi:hypothetical protein
MNLENIWNNIKDWFVERSDRICLIAGFNQQAKEAFIAGLAPTMLKASVSKGDRAYRHEFSSWFNTGFRIQALSGRALKKDEMIFIGNVVLENKELVRRLVALGWDTLEVHDNQGCFGCKWELINYAKIDLMLE